MKRPLLVLLSLVLLHQGDVPALTVKAGQRLAGGCDVAVRVQSVAFDAGEARFALEVMGHPKVGEQGVACKRTEPAIQLVLSGFASGPPTPETTARIDELLLTPEASLASRARAKRRRAGRRPGGPADRA